MKVRIEVINEYNATIRIYLNKTLRELQNLLEIEKGEGTKLKITDMDTKEEIKVEERRNCYFLYKEIL